MPLIESSVNVP